MEIIGANRKVDTLRRELLLLEVPKIYSNPSKIGIRFNLVQREQSNAIHHGKSKNLINQIGEVAKKTLSRKNSIHLENLSPSRITRVIVSEKKMRKASMNVNIVLEDTHFADKTAVLQDIAREALRKIRHYGLYLRELRSDITNAISKSEKKIKAKPKDKSCLSSNAIPILLTDEFAEPQEDEITATNLGNLFAASSIRPRKESVIQTFNNISNFVDSLLNDEPQATSKVSHPFDNDRGVRRRSSFYDELSEGSLTEEDEEEIRNINEEKQALTCESQ